MTALDTIDTSSWTLQEWVVGSDSYLDGAGAMEWKLLGHQSAV